MSLARAARLRALRARLQTYEPALKAGRVLAFRDPRIDGCFPAGGLPRGCWHELEGAGPEVALGMTANVLVSSNAAAATREAIVLPLTALYRKDDKAAVWIVDPKSGQVALKPVTVGNYRENGVEIQQGVSAGDVVVTAGVNKLVAGQVVRPLAPAPSPEGANVKAPR